MNVGFYLGMNKNVIYTLAEIHPKKCKKRYNRIIRTSCYISVGSYMSLRIPPDR